MKLWKSLLLILLVSAFASSARADHLADKLAASGRPETKLAGIHLTDHTKLAEVIRLYGKPTRIKSWASTEPQFWGSYEYDWKRAGINLHIVVECPFKVIPENGVVTLIETNAGTSRKIARTGRGLRIGQSLRDLQRLYGRRYHLRYIPSRRIHDVALAWRQKEYTLIATLDGHNRITGLSLVASE